MPAAKAGESKQALVVTLVFFILLSIILSVLWYMSFSEADKLAKDKTTADNAEKSAKSERDTQRNMALLYRGYMGVPPADKLELKVAYEDYVSKVAGKNDKDGNDKTLAELEKKLGWNKANGLPNTDMDRKVRDLEKEKTDLQGQVAHKDEELKKKESELKTARNQRDAIEAESKKRFEELKERADKDLKKYEQDVQKAREEFGDSGKAIAQLKEDIENLQKENAKLLTTKNKEIKDLQTRLNKLEDRKPTYTAMTSDQPKGKIVLMDKTGNLPFVNLGSADNVRPQLTFSIHGIGTDGRPLKDPKGSLEITNVVREHLSQARITQQFDQTRDPIVTGDVLMNAAWDPNQKRHVAIAGIVDLSGDARTDRPADARRAVEAFIRTLENQNMVVDAWLDFGDNSVKGKGISRATDYLILGIMPEGKAGVVREDDPANRRREDVQKLANKMIEDATKAGVPVMRLRDFMALTGQRPPRSTQEDNLSKIHSSVPAAGSPVEKSVPAPKPSDEGKDKDEKDKNGKQ
ncbi:MAG TPA: hypothetical protein VKE94_04790 [Gemmataceae bacterium]|nr:hypothetical protein [Gemmataceae bacterium]